MEQNYNCPRCETEMYIILDNDNNFLEYFCSDCSFSHKFHREGSTSNTSDECFRCSVCDCELIGIHSLNPHVAEHFKENTFKCNTCNESFESEAELKSHEAIHDDGDFYKCPFCEEQFEDGDDMQKHVKSRHENTCTCPYCGYQVPLTADFNCTFVMYCCPICGGQFSQQINGENTVPLGSDPDKPYRCGVCGRQFSLSCNLRRHLTVHTGERPFACETCNKRFKAKAALQRHEIIHTGVYPFQCPSCKQRFNQTANLWKHMLIHKADYPYHCHVCQKGCNQRSNLKKHMRVHEREMNFVYEKMPHLKKIKSAPQPETSRPIITFLRPASSQN